MNRRAFLFAIPAVATTSAWAQAGLEVIYVGGLDCPPCTQWKNGYRAEWLASPEFARVTWIEIDPPKLREAYQERHWPGRLKPILEQLPRRSGTPRFLVVRDGTVVFNEFGVSKWTAAMIEIRKLVGQA